MDKEICKVYEGELILDSWFHGARIKKQNGDVVDRYADGSEELVEQQQQQQAEGE